MSCATMFSDDWVPLADQCSPNSSLSNAPQPREMANVATKEKSEGRR
jgi:hypothetical protein